MQSNNISNDISNEMDFYNEYAQAKYDFYNQLKYDWTSTEDNLSTLKLAITEDAGNN